MHFGPRKSRFTPRMVAVPHISHAVELRGDNLTVPSLVRAARRYAPVAVAPEAVVQVQRSFLALLGRLERGEPVYGLTTGVGALDRCAIPDHEWPAIQVNLLRSHAAGVGPPAPGDVVRAMMIARVNTLAQGRSGVRPAVVGELVDMLNRHETPRVPMIGSVGASDLAPLAHLGLALIERGVRLEGRDAFALINGLAFSTGLGALAVYDAYQTVAASEVATAMTMVALGSNSSSLEPRALKLHSSSIDSAARIRELLDPNAGDGRLREPLSIRCAHEITGACRSAVANAVDVVETEFNGPGDNPQIDADGWCTNNSASFHGQHLANTFDSVSASLTSLGVMSERHTARLLAGEELPRFLIHPDAHAGICSGFMIAQYTAVALVAELRARAPVAALSMPTCDNTEDHVSMAALAARRAAACAEHTAQIVAIELLCAAQAIDLRGVRMSDELAAFHHMVRAAVPVLVVDRPPADDIEIVTRMIRDGLFASRGKPRPAAQLALSARYPSVDNR